MIPALVAAIPSLIQAGAGIAQMISGRKQLKNNVRPEYATPDEAKRNLALTRQQYADPRFPGQQLAINQNQMAAANAAQAAIEGGAGVSGLSGIAAAQAAGGQNIAAQAAQYHQAALGTLMSQQDTMAQYRDTEWQMNKFSPYSQRYNEGREKIGAGLENLYGGAQSLASIGLGALNTNTLGGGQPITAQSIGASAATATNSAGSQNQSANAIANIMKYSMMLGNKYIPTITPK